MTPIHTLFPSSVTECEFDEDTVAADDSNNVTGSQGEIWSRPQHPLNFCVAHPFIGALSGLMIQEAPHVNKDTSSIITFLSFTWS
jgi:hypothetical protein